MKNFFSIRNGIFNNALATATLVAIFVDVIVFMVMMPESFLLWVILGLTVVIIAIVAPLIVIIDIKNWHQDYKDAMLFNEVKADNYSNVWWLLVLGANPNAKIDKAYENWDHEKSWCEQFEYALDVAKSEKMERLLSKHGATCRTKQN